MTRSQEVAAAVAEQVEVALSSVEVLPTPEEVAREAFWTKQNEKHWEEALHWQQVRSWEIESGLS